MASLSRVVRRLASLFLLVRRFAESITGMLTCFDRVVFKRYLPIVHEAGLEGFVDPGFGRLHVRLQTWFPFVEPGDSLAAQIQVGKQANLRRLDVLSAVVFPLRRGRISNH